MIIAKNDEEKRSKIWRIVMFTATIVILVVVAFFLIKLFTANPVEGTWKQEDNDLTLTFGKSSVSAQWEDLLEESNVRLKFRYSLDKDAKTLTIKGDGDELQKVADKSDGQFTKAQLEAAVSSLATSFDYSVESRKLILTEREYGEQITFVKK